MSFCTITPTRGDRPNMLEFCKWQIDRMNPKPDQSYFIDHKPFSTSVDLVDRVRKGVEFAINDGHDYAFILEDDDWYSPDYFRPFMKPMREGIDFLGVSTTTYYNLRNKTYQKYNHPGRASLFQTGFKLKALEKFKWPTNRVVMLDLYLWAYARMSRNKLSRFFHQEPVALGIKHGLGVCGGKAHKLKLRHSDQHHAFLKSSVGLEAFKFYLTI